MSATKPQHSDGKSSPSDAKDLPLKLKITAITPPVQHAEGPHWDYKTQALYYVDTFAPAVLRWQHTDGKTTMRKLGGDSVAIIVPIKDQYQRFLIARDREVFLYVWDENNYKFNFPTLLTSVDKGKQKNQFNDGKVDSLGRLWVGTLTRNEDLTVAPHGGSLFLIKSNNLTKPEMKLSQLSISNGIAWSKDSKKLFHIDSDSRKITRYSFDLKLGNIANPETVFDMADYSHLKGIPDGMTSDVEDNLWVALYEGKAVIKIDSTNGKLIQTIEMPTTYVTSVAFGGPNLDMLFITTSKQKLSPQELLNEPLAGSVFAVSHLGVRGCPANDFVLHIDFNNQHNDS